MNLRDFGQAVDSNGRTIWIADAHRDDGKRFVVRADEKLTAFMELRIRDEFVIRLKRLRGVSKEPGRIRKRSHENSKVGAPGCGTRICRTKREADVGNADASRGHFKSGTMRNDFSSAGGMPKQSDPPGARSASHIRCSRAIGQERSAPAPIARKAKLNAFGEHDSRKGICQLSKYACWKLRLRQEECC